MIFCNDKIFLKVWKVTPHEKYIDLQATTSEKNKDGTYTNSRWFARVIGHAFNNLTGKIKEGDKIVSTKSKFTNETIKNDDGSYKNMFKFLILEADFLTQAEAPAADDTTFVSKSEEKPATEDDCPW